jgi:DNA-binding NtrC family response regulator
MARNKILVVEDEVGIRFGIRDFLESSGYEVKEAESCQTAVAIFQTARPDIAIIDYLLADGTALELLPRLKALYPEIPLVILTAHGSIDLAVRAVKEGAEQFLTKPIELPILLIMLQRLLEEQRNRQKQIASKSRQARRDVDPFLGTSMAIRQLAEDARKVLDSESPILIQGETGTGKGVLAKWLHDHGPRSEEAFVDVNCAGLAREFLETELFGHAKGAFTGAATSKTGLLEVGHGGTVFLDEIGDLDAQMQPRLLKVLEEKRFRRLGEVHERRVDIRLIAATHQDLGRLIQEKKFRSDLHFRINTLPLVVPPCGSAARTFSSSPAFSCRRGLPVWGVARSCWHRTPSKRCGHTPGLSDQPVLRRKDLRFDATGPEGAADDTELSLKELERRHIQRVLHREQGHVESAARRLGIPRSTLYQKIKQYQIILPKL